MDFEAPKTCGNCGELGHNRATCTNATVPKPAKVASGRVCHNCGGAGHNVRTCTLPKSISSVIVASKPKKTRKCGTCGNVGHNSATCSANTPTLTPSAGKTPAVVAVVPEVISTPANITQPTTTDTLYGIDISKMKKKEVRGQDQYETPKGTFIVFPQINVTREVAFMNVVRRIKETVEDRKNNHNLDIVFKVKEIDRKAERVPDKYIRYAKMGALPGTYPKDGHLHWDIITYMIEHSEFEDPKFEYIGKIVLTNAGDARAGHWEFFSQLLYRDDKAHPNYEEYEPISASLDKQIIPQIKKYMEIFAKRSDAKGNRQFPDGQDELISKKLYKGNAMCFKCNPLGDDMWRQSADLFLTTEDIPSYKIGRLGTDKGSKAIPKGTIIPLGEGCEFSVNPIDIELLASLYGNSRLKARYQHTWRNPLLQGGWGFKVMDMNNYLTRVFGYYNKKLDLIINEALEYGESSYSKAYSNRKLSQLKEFQLPDSLVMEGGISYKALNPYKLNILLEQSSYRSRDELKKFQQNFMRMAFPDTESTEKKGAKGIYENSKASFLLTARMFSHTLPNGEETSWLQSGNRYSLGGNNTVGGIETFLNEYENMKGDPNFFIEVEQPLYNDDGLPIEDENGDIVTEDIELPNPEKLRELYGFDGGIVQVLRPDEVQQDVEDAIEFVRNLDANNLPPILLKYFKTNRIINPQQLITKLDGVTSSDKTGGPKIAQSIWQIYNIFKLQERREVSYAKYREEEQERHENRIGSKALRITLTDDEKELINKSGWYDTEDYFDDGIITDDERILMDTFQHKTTMELMLGGNSEEVLYYDESSWSPTLLDDLKIILDKIEVADKAKELVRELANEIERKIIGEFYKQTRNIYGMMGRASYHGNHYTISNLAQGELYTNSEIFNLLGLNYSYTEAQMKEIEDVIEPNIRNYNFELSSSGLFTEMTLSSVSAQTIKSHFEKKQMANLGMGHSPTIATPTITPTVTKLYKQDQTHMAQLERELKHTGFPHVEGENITGYIFSITNKVYNRPYPNDTVYVGVITAGNADDDENGNYLNFAYQKSVLDSIIPSSNNYSARGKPVQMSFKKTKVENMWGKTQTIVKVSDIKGI